MMGGATYITGKEEHPSMETLAAFLDGSLDVYEREEILKHIADCDDCRCFVADWVRLESLASNGNYR